MKLHSLITLLALSVSSMSAQSTAAFELDSEYARVIAARAEKIVTPLGIADAAKAARVSDAVARHYRNLREIDDAREAKLNASKDSEDKASAREAAQRDADMKRFAVHWEFLGKLYGDLTLEQIEGVKDGLTYNVFPNTYRVYLEMLPDLSDEQRAQIKAWLAEAREYAMDAGSSDEKHKWFGKYKGKINNYLSAAGYDMKKAERDLAERRKQAKAQK